MKSLACTLLALVVCPLVSLFVFLPLAFLVLVGKAALKIQAWLYGIKVFKK